MDKDTVVKNVDLEMKTLHGLLDDIVVGYEEDTTIVQRISDLFIQKRQSLSLAESCTGGAISEQITALAGVSAFFKGGIVSYATNSKIDVLGLDEELINKHSVVSKEVAEAMAIQSKRLFNSDYALSTTGIAGPSKGDSSDEVGTVFIAIAGPKGVISEKFAFGKPREKVIARASNKAFEMILKEILKN